MLRQFLSNVLISIIFLYGCNHPEAATSTKSIESYIKVWGYLKYFHPDITGGKVNWDSAFIAIFPKSKNTSEYKEAINDLIAAAGGEKSFGIDAQSQHDVKILADFSWLKDSTQFNAEQQRILAAIYSNKVPESSRYISKYPSQNPNFESEDSSLINPFPNEATRALSIARHWNAVEYFYPNLDLISSWSDTLSKYLPRVLSAKDVGEFQHAILEYCCSIRDGHSATYGPALFSLQGQYYLPLPITTVGQDLVFRKPRIAVDLPFKPGDILRSIGGKSVKQLISEWAPRVPHSNDAAILRNTAFMICSSSTPDSVIIEFEEAGGNLRTSKLKPLSPLDRQSLKQIDTGAEPWRILNDNIGYVNLALLFPRDLDRAMKELSNPKAIVFDIRNYPNGVVWPLASWLRSTVPWARFRRPNYSSPGSFRLDEYQPRKKSYFGSDRYSGKVIALVNSETQSHAEYTAMMLRLVERSTIIGSQTAGADGNVSMIQLPGGIKTMFSGLGVYYPDGTPTQQTGIIPDIEVHPTIAGIRAGRDEVLERAIKFCNQQ